MEFLDGTWGDLFPGNAGVEPSHRALAVDVTDHDGVTRRLLVPSSADPRHEAELRAIAGHDGTHLMWHSLRADGRFEIRFATVSGDASSPQISQMAKVSDAAGDALLFDRAPLLVVTRDSFHLDGEAEDEASSVKGSYTLVHLLWRDGSEGAGLAYTDLTFVDGVYVGWHRLFDLDALLGAAAADGEGDEGGATLPASLAATLGWKVAGDGSSLVVTYGDAANRRLGTFEISPLPMVLSVLGDGVRDEIYGAADFYDPEDLSAFTEKVKGSVIAIGFRARVHPAVREYVADRLGSWIDEVGADYGFGGFLELGEDARDLVIDLSSSVFASTIEDPSAPGATIVEIDLGDLVGDGPAPQQLLDLHPLIEIPAPPGIGEAAEAFVVSSADGSQLAVAWQNAGESVVRYVEAGADGIWSDERRLPLGPLSNGEARRLLSAKLR